MEGWPDKIAENVAHVPPVLKGVKPAIKHTMVMGT
jgi:hypothetical protein